MDEKQIPMDPQQTLSEEVPVTEPVAPEENLSAEAAAEALTAPEPVVAEGAAAPALEEELRFIDEQINDNWLEDFLQQKQAEEAEIGADQEAIAAAGLIAPEDRELESILAENWDAEESPLPEKAEEAFPVEEELPIDIDEEEAIGEAEQEADIFAEVSAEEPADEPVDEAPVYEDDADEQTPEDTEAPVVLPKRRPKMKKGYGLLGIPHILATVIWAAIIVVIAVPLGRLAWMYVADVFAFGRESQSITLTITEADVAEGDLTSISQKLHDAGIIRYPGLFRQFASLTGKGERIDPGTYTLNSHLDYNALLNGMVDYGPVREVVELMFPEGYNCAQIFAKLEEEGVCSVADLEEHAANGELADYWFLEGVERGHKYCLEGYLAPNTYQFYTNDEPGRVLEKFLDAFDASFTDKMHEDFQLMQHRYNTMLSQNGYGSDYIEANPLTFHMLVTLASIVQKETAGDDESYDIASVFYNRLTNPGNHPYLGSDATVYYAIGDYFGEKEDLTQADLDFDSPYNTRNHQGLPPGPICNPGAYTMYAALDPNPTDYYYFVYSAVDREHLFSSTLAEHEAKLRELGL